MTRLRTLTKPSFNRATVGFERLFQELDRQFENSKSISYPPYNVVEINKDEWMISVAVAGFSMENLEITKDQNSLRIEGKTPMALANEDLNYLHKGIGSRNFQREFTLADHVEVTDATLDLGILNIHLKREVPQERQPKKIEITHQSQQD